MARVPGELPPESKANEPVELKTIEEAAAGRAMGGSKYCRVEKIYKVFPPSPRIKVFNPSGENAAAVALLMLNGRAEDEAPKRYTWLGLETVSEKTACVPLCETAMTLPVTRPRGVPGADR